MRTPTPLSKNTYFLPSAGSAVFLRSICRALTALGLRIGLKRKVLQYLKGRKRRLERFLCGRISPAPLNFPGFCHFGAILAAAGRAVQEHGRDARVRAAGRRQSAARALAPAAASANSPARMRSAHAITCASLDSRVDSGAISSCTWPSTSL